MESEAVSRTNHFQKWNQLLRHSEFPMTQFRGSIIIVIRKYSWDF